MIVQFSKITIMIKFLKPLVRGNQVIIICIVIVETKYFYDSLILCIVISIKLDNMFAIFWQNTCTLNFRLQGLSTIYHIRLGSRYTVTKLAPASESPIFDLRYATILLL